MLIAAKSFGRTEWRLAARPREWVRAATLVVTALCASSIAPALDPGKNIDQYGHDTWTSQNGLPREAVYQILQTRDGYLWLRTSAGLVR